jgi:hypothetical protein
MRIERVMMTTTLGLWLLAGTVFAIRHLLGVQALGQVAILLFLLGVFVWAVPPLLAIAILGGAKLIQMLPRRPSRRE